MITIEGIRKLVEELRAGTAEQGGYFVKGSGFVYVPRDRLGEVTKVSLEYYGRECELVRLQVLLVRRSW